MPEFSSDLSALAGPQYGYPTSEMIEDNNYIGYMQDVNGNGTIDLLSGVAPFGYRSIGPSTMPTITIDDQNRVFVAFASTTEGYDNFTNNFKKIWARAYDNGIWGPFLHVTADIIHIFDESINPLFAQSSDDNVYLIYNTDGTPGIALDGDHDYQENSIWFSSIPKTDVLTGIGDNVTISNTSVSQNYPNPFNGITTITVNLEKAADLSMTVSNILGQQVMNMNRGNVSSGTYYFQVDGTDLQDGVYFYTVKANNTEVTKKMIVR
jgi:flagellar hook assembly protein FlgD